MIENIKLSRPFGVISHRKGVTLESEYGEERAQQIRSKLRQSHLGKEPANKGIYKYSREERNCLICGTKFEAPINSIKKYCCFSCGTRGSSWNRGQTKETNSSVASTSKKLTGRHSNENQRNKFVLSSLGKPSLKKNKTLEEQYGEDKARIIKQKISKSCIEDHKNNPEKYLTSNSTEINKDEKRILQIITRFNPQFEFVGNGRFWKTIEKKHFNPDFINRKDYQIVEYFGDHWHELEEEKERIRVYKSIGYDCLIIWGHELRNEEEVIKKVKNFVLLGKD